MNASGNILWGFPGVFVILFVYIFGTLILIISIIGDPSGLQILKKAVLAMAPFRIGTQPGERAGGCLYYYWHPFCAVHIKIEVFALFLVEMDIKNILHHED